MGLKPGDRSKIGGAFNGDFKISRQQDQHGKCNY